jgi:ubiquinone/menaquinone biosynthesis C-methylase UbiE
MAKRSSWDTELYEAQHGFVWKYGEDLIQLLDPKPGERILDLGCGTGQLTQKIAEHGADVVGLDASPEMIGQARQNFPSLRFLLQDAANMNFREEFDAIFSNAALHWMLDAPSVAKSMFRALRKGGRMVAELGGKGNIRQIEAATEAVLLRYLGDGLPPRRTFFPSIGEYAGLLESCGLEVRSAVLFKAMMAWRSGCGNLLLPTSRLSLVNRDRKRYGTWLKSCVRPCSKRADGMRITGVCG